MSAHTTLRITRHKAFDVIFGKLASGIPDDELEAIVNMLLEPMLYRVLIVHNETENEDDELRT
jgi:hypothetical protein